MDRHAIGLRRVVQGARVGLHLGRHVRVDLAPHDPGIGQYQQAVDEHLAATIKATGKRLDAAFAADQRRPLVHIQVGEQQAIGFVVGLARQQGSRQCIAHGADANLQRTAITHQGAGMQADKMILKAHRHVRSGEQRGAVFFIQQVVELIHAQLGIARHVGQIAMDLADDQDGLPSRAALGDHGHQVEGDIRVAAQAQAVGMLAATGNQLRHQVQAGGIDVAGRMAVVAADVILLRRGAVEQAAGLHEELLHTDIPRQAALVQVREEIQLGVVAKHSFDERFDKALLKTVTLRRTAQAQGRIERQRPFGQFCDAPVQRVDEQIGLAQPQRHAHVDMRRQALQYVVNCLLD